MNDENSTKISKTHCESDRLANERNDVAWYDSTARKDGKNFETIRDPLASWCVSCENISATVRCHSFIAIINIHTMHVNTVATSNSSVRYLFCSRFCSLFIGVFEFLRALFIHRKMYEQSHLSLGVNRVKKSENSATDQTVRSSKWIFNK